MLTMFRMLTTAHMYSPMIDDTHAPGGEGLCKTAVHLLSRCSECDNRTHNSC